MTEEQLKREILELRKQIEITEDQLFSLYDTVHVQTIMPHYKKRKSLLNRKTKDPYGTEVLKCCFYENFMKIIIKKDDVIVAFPRKEDKYGIQIKNNGDDCAITHYMLPVSVKPEQFIYNMNTIPTTEISYSVGLVHRSLQAFFNRKDQVSQLTDYNDRVGKLSVSPCCKIIRIEIEVEAKSKGKTNSTIILRYNDLSIRPMDVQLYFDDGTVLNEKRKNKLSERCKDFLVKNLLDGYKNYYGFD